ncbi:hypothetical protein [Thalassomonas sp. M1454]|uniref:hypothetical protein n=1 Tax=Thalassomonas sp. M1454 TaxID=2594477 RepID=UPI00117DB8DA|nr:hypothetical protein [Thalassomonas sp. M1454]TRX57057.1 hypothetical protein FNN08_06030 [Thalassomonas sp. M1454]
MLSSLLNRLPLGNSAPLLDESTRNWILDTYQWAVNEFDLAVFKQDTQLILPINKFYPGTVSSIEEMAQSVFDNTLTYAGMSNWPIRLVSPSQFVQKQMPKLEFVNGMRGNEAKVINNDFSQNNSGEILVSYNPQQINQPQDLVASFAQVFSSILIAQRGVLPPGGEKFIPQAIDLLACFMGFGVMFANTAYQFKGGCGSCYNKHANREVALPEQEMVYCLAVFSVLKTIPKKEVSYYLKSHLRSDFNKAYKELTKSSGSDQLENIKRLTTH